MNSGPTTTAISCSTSAPRASLGAQTTARRERSRSAAAVERAEDVWRRTARADADDHVFGRELEGRDVALARSPIVLGGCLLER